MGSGRYDSGTYTRSATLRASTGRKDFEYTESATKVHPTLDPLRINSKPFGKLESRDNEEHPNSTAVVISFDVTGSNRSNAVVAQKKLNALMDGLAAVIPDPQVAAWANDDWMVQGTRNLGAVMQMAEFESDNRVDEHLRNIILVGNGGGNDHESYDAVLYGAAYKTVLDCIEKRGRRGYLFMYADEPFPYTCDPKMIKDVFGDKVKEPIKIETLIADSRKLYNVYVLWPENGYPHARDQYVKLFGKEFVIELQSPEMIVEACVGRVQVDAEKEAAAAAAVKGTVSA